MADLLDQILGWARDGGPIVWLLALLSVYSLALITVKVIGLSGTFSGAAPRNQAIADWRRGARDQARSHVSSGLRPADRVLGYAMEGLQAGLDRSVLREEIARRGNQELMQLGHHLRMLEVIAMVSPLMGLLGTVLGMIESFQELELAQGSANASVLAGGIWQALLTTAMGLIVAIPAAIAANLLSARVDRVGHGIENVISALFEADHARLSGS